MNYPARVGLSGVDTALDDYDFSLLQRHRRFRVVLYEISYRQYRYSQPT